MYFICQDISEQVYELVPRQKCYSKHREVCHDVPDEACIDVPRKKCTQVPVQGCKPAPRKECTLVPIIFLSFLSCFTAKILFISFLKWTPACRDGSFSIFKKNNCFVMKTTTKKRKTKQSFFKRSFLKEIVLKDGRFLNDCFWKQPFLYISLTIVNDNPSLTTTLR